MEQLEQLNEQHANCPGLSFARLGDLLVAQIETHQCRATVAFQGAQITEWQPLDDTFHDEPVLWLTRIPEYEVGKSVRGGIPICWPWFGDHPFLPQTHGFARNVNWTLNDAECRGDGTVVLHWRLRHSDRTLDLWPHHFQLDLRMEIGAMLRLALTTTNLDADPFSITQGLHTYLHVGDIRRVVIRGLAGTYYMDKLANFSRSYQDDVIEFDGPLDRIFLGTHHPVDVEDRVLGRRIRVAKSGSHSTVVWNPGRVVPSGMEEAEHRDMVCVEATNAGDDVVSIPAGASHTIETLISQHLLAD